jgi:hypothetical protein
MTLIAGVLGRPPRLVGRATAAATARYLEQAALDGPPHPPLVFGAYPPDAPVDGPRWRDLARGSTLAVLVSAVPQPEWGADQALIHFSPAPGDPLGREWMLVVNAGPERCGLLIARDAPPDPREPDGPPRSEAVISFDVELVRAACLWVTGYLAGRDVPLSVRWNAAVAVLSTIEGVRRGQRRGRGAAARPST